MLADDYWGYNSTDGCGPIYAGEIEDYRLDVCAVNIRYKMWLYIFMIRFKRFGYHVRAKIRTSYADVHNVSYRFTRMTFPIAA